MVKKKQFKKRYLFGSFIILAALFVFHYTLSFNESIYTDGFPIPGKAEVVMVSANNKLESYKWKGASKDKGLPLPYEAAIRLAGWKKTNTFGTMSTYEKDGVKIEIVSTTKTIDLYSDTSVIDD